VRVPLIDMVAEYRAIQPEVDEAIRGVLEGGYFILGPNVAALESEVAAYVGVKHGVGVASGTDALVLTLRALGIGPGDEVIVPTYTFFATAEAVMLVGATPVFVDVLADTYCLDCRQVAEQITPRTKAVIPVHLYGHPADMEPLLELGRAHGVKVIEDNAQAFGAEYHGRKTGSMGEVACLSFFPSKHLGAYGDGGMVVTNDDEVAQQVRMLRTHGWRKKYFPEVIGHNSRLDELQAAILRVKLRHVEARNNRRRFLADVYTDRLSDLELGLPGEAPHVRHAYHLYIIRSKERDWLQAYLKERGIGSAVYYPQAVHASAPCRALAGHEKRGFPVAERASRETLAIPLYPEMSEQHVEHVVSVLHRALSTAGVCA
jgi:dTDP-4-amino-4,6-dideoxygalactose transaminase